MQQIRKMYNRYKKGNPNHISDKEYRKVLNLIYKSIREIIIESGYFKLPLGLGVLYVVRHEYIPKYKNGKLIGLPPISFNKTMKLWKEDKESRINKVLIRHTDTVFYIAKYSKKGTSFPNRDNYKFKYTKDIKSKINSYNNER